MSSGHSLLQTEDVPLKTKDSLLTTEENGNELRSTGPNLVPLLATRCLYWGGTYELRSTGPNLVPLLTTRCLYQGVGGTSENYRWSTAN